MAETMRDMMNRLEFEVRSTQHTSMNTQRGFVMSARQLVVLIELWRAKHGETYDERCPRCLGLGMPDAQAKVDHPKSDVCPMCGGDGERHV